MRRAERTIGRLHFQALRNRQFEEALRSSRAWRVSPSCSIPAVVLNQAQSFNCGIDAVEQGEIYAKVHHRFYGAWRVRLATFSARRCSDAHRWKDILLDVVFVANSRAPLSPVKNCKSCREVVMHSQTYLYKFYTTSPGSQRPRRIRLRLIDALPILFRLPRKRRRSVDQNR